MSKLQLIAVSLLISLYNVNTCQARYLPTRSQEDRLLRLKELIQELFELEERRVPQKREQYGNVSHSKGFYSESEDEAPTDDSAAYSITYDSHEADPRIIRNLFKRQQILKI